MSTSKKVRRLRLEFAVQAWNPEMDAWIERARFLDEYDALEYCRNESTRSRRVRRGRHTIAAYSGVYIPPSARAGVGLIGPDEPVTEAPEH